MQPERPLQHLSHTCSGMSTYSQHSPQQSLSSLSGLPAGRGQSNYCSQPPSEVINFGSSQQWDSIHSQSTQILCASTVSPHIKAQAQPRDPQNALLLIKSGPEKTVLHQKQDKQTVIGLSVQRGTATVSCCTSAMVPSGSPSSDVGTSSCKQTSQVQISDATSVLTEDTQAFNNVLDSNMFTSKPFAYTETVDYKDTKDSGSNNDTGESSNSGRIFPPFFFSGQLHGYPSAECLPSGVRAVQSCQENTEDTSSSDDEGKLIIEL